MSTIEHGQVVIYTGPPSAEPPRGKAGAVLLGLLAMLASVGGFGVWAVTAPIASAVVAPGKVAVSSKRQQVQHNVGGIISAIHIRDGDAVKPGDILFELDATSAGARYLVARNAYFGSLATKARIDSERSGRSMAVLPPELMEAASADPNIAGLIKVQQQLLSARSIEYEGQIAVWKRRIAQFKEEINGLDAERRAAEAQSELAVSELAVLKELFSKGYTTRTRVLAITREKTQLEGQRGRLSGQVARAEEEIRAAELQIAQLGKKREMDNVAELREVQQKIADSKEQYLALKAELERLLIRAPVGGIVLGSQVHTVGGVVRPADTLAEIVPLGDHLIVETRVRAQDVDDVRVGQPTEIRLAAFNRRTTPTLLGRVEYLAADAVSDARTGESYYVSNIHINGPELAKLGSQTLLPGMPAEVLIRTGERTAMAYLLQPIHDSINRAWREH
jgi:HlyD family type I secretion membrane fusion protein